MQAAVVPVVVTGFFLGSFYGVATAIYYSERYECGQVTVNTGTATKFVKNHLLSWDCYVSVDGKWIPLDKWRGDSD